jgi:hypothetical protein
LVQVAQGQQLNQQQELLATIQLLAPLRLKVVAVVALQILRQQAVLEDQAAVAHGLGMADQPQHLLLGRGTLVAMLLVVRLIMVVAVEVDQILQGRLYLV